MNSTRRKIEQVSRFNWKNLTIYRRVCLALNNEICLIAGGSDQGECGGAAEAPEAGLE
jgi:hypothetical protein